MLSDLQQISRPERGLRCSQGRCHHIHVLVLRSLEWSSASGSQRMQNGAQNNRCHEGRAMHLGQILNTGPTGGSAGASPWERMDPLLSVGGMPVQYNLRVPNKCQQTVNGVCALVTLPTWETQLLAWVHPQRVRSRKFHPHLLFTQKMKGENNFLGFFTPSRVSQHWGTQSFYQIEENTESVSPVAWDRLKSSVFSTQQQNVQPMAPLEFDSSKLWKKLCSFQMNLNGFNIL